MRSPNNNPKQSAPSLPPADGSENVPKPAEGRVLVDSSQVPALNRNPTLDGQIGQGEQPVVSFVTTPELRNVISINQKMSRKGLRGIPRLLYELPVLAFKPNIHLRINIRGKLPPGRGRFGDGIIGAQALENQLPLITKDRNLADVVEELGGIVRRLRMEEIRVLTFEADFEQIDFPGHEPVKLTYKPNKTGKPVDITVIAFGKEFSFPMFAECGLKPEKIPGETSFHPLIYSIVSDSLYPVIILFGLLSVVLIDVRKQLCHKLVDLFRTSDDDSGFYELKFEKLSDGFLIVYESGIMRLKKNGEVLWHTQIYWDDIYRGINKDYLVLASEYGEFAPDDWGISLTDGKKVRLPLRTVSPSGQPHGF